MYPPNRTGQRRALGSGGELRGLVEGEAVTLLQPVESMFELGFLEVSDMRWRAPTKTFRKEL